MYLKATNSVLELSGRPNKYMFSPSGPRAPMYETEGRLIVEDRVAHIINHFSLPSLTILPPHGPLRHLQHARQQDTQHRARCTQRTRWRLCLSCEPLPPALRPHRLAQPCAALTHAAASPLRISGTRGRGSGETQQSGGLGSY